MLTCNIVKSSLSSVLTVLGKTAQSITAKAAITSQYVFFKDRFTDQIFHLYRINILLTQRINKTLEEKADI